MAKGRSKTQSNGGKGSKHNVLGRLSSAEAASVLHLLLQRHPELQPEAENAATDLLSEVSFLAVADDIESAVLGLDYDDLNSRAGRHSWGYVEPTEAAWELLEEAVEPFRDDMKRYLELGLEEQARELCQGILLGLYRVRGGEKNDVLNWAPDFPGEAAGHAFEVWSQTTPAGKSGKRRLPRSFVAEYIPEWEWAADRSERSR